MYFNFFVFSIVVSGLYRILGLLFCDIRVTRNSIMLFDITELAN